ncbi:hypothetical protein FOXYSP1_19265 [Fusarium oxysporum f. sp. phaseoli]
MAVRGTEWAIIGCHCEVARFTPQTMVASSLADRARSAKTTKT